MTNFRYPDKPAREITRVGLDDLKEDYIATLKMDGWRCVVAIGKAQQPTALWSITYIARTGEPIPISSQAQQAFEEQLFKAEVPVGTVLDGEWLGRRANQPEHIWLFDALVLAGQPLYRRGSEQRFESLLRMFDDPCDLVVPRSYRRYGDFFDGYRHDRADAEGIVLKRLGAPYIGSMRACAKNPAWIKCKWRGGEDGQTPLHVATVRNGAQHHVA